MVKVEDNWVEFLFFRPGANRVHLVGDFNGWHESSLPMARLDDGYWTARLRLPPGEYKFRYRSDGQWFTDYAAFGVEHGPFGLDSIIKVPLHVQKKAMPVVPPAQAAGRRAGLGLTKRGENAVSAA